MNKTSSKILIYAVIFLAVLNIATFVTIGYHIYQSNTQTSRLVNKRNNTPSYNGRYFRDRLQLNSKQMNSFRNINAEFRTHARNINSRLNDIRKEMLTEMSKNTVDTMKLNALSDSVGQLHKSLKISSYHYYLGIKKICNQNQTIELNNIFKEFFIGHEFHHAPLNQGQNCAGCR